MTTETLGRERVYDPVLRVIHAWNGLLVVLLAISAFTAEQLEFRWPAAALWQIHLWLGYLLLAGVVARFTWGMVGPVHARWRALWHPRAWLQALRQRRFLIPQPGYGHHPLASAVYLGVYLAWAVAAVSGLALAAIDQGQGPLYELLGYHLAYKAWFRMPHGWLDELMLAFVVVHIGALIAHERREGVPMAQSMISGYQYRKEKE